MTGPYAIFKTNEDLETGGVTINYGDFKITIARAGGSNKKYQKALEKATRPFRRAIETGTMAEGAMQQTLAGVYADSVVLGWDGVTDETGAELEFSRDNVVKLLTDLPDMFTDLIQQASKIALFKADDLAADAKN